MNQQTRPPTIKDHTGHRKSTHPTQPPTPSVCVPSLCADLMPRFRRFAMDQVLIQLYELYHVEICPVEAGNGCVGAPIVARVNDV